MKKRIEQKYDKRINVTSHPTLKVKGVGRSCLSLLDYAKTIIEQEKKKNREYDHVWLIYDLDDFPYDDFDNTANSVKAMNESDQCFKY